MQRDNMIEPIRQLIVTIIILVLLVQILQAIGMMISKKLDRRVA